MTIIRRENGETYNLDDYGIRTRFFNVESPNAKNNLEEVPGRTGLVDYGSDFGTRIIEVGFRIISKDQTDFPLFRNEIFNLLASDEALYISESRRKSAQWLVRVGSPYSIEKRNLHGYFTTKFISITGFAESTYTTLELHDSGYSATAEKYGLVDNIDDEKVEYRFDCAPFNPNLMSEPYHYKSPLDNPFQNILQGGLPRGEYTISFNYKINQGDPKSFLVYANGVLTDVLIKSGRLSGSFIIDSAQENTTIRLYGGSSASEGLSTDVDFSNIKIESGNKETPFDGPITKFSLYNAGNVTVEPESMHLNIFASYVQSTGDFTIRNKTTGEEIVLQRESNGSHFRIYGMVISLGSITNIFRDTNKRFISLAPGDNEIEVANGTFEEVRFDFKFLYK